jgi:hypothetical protein
MFRSAITLLWSPYFTGWFFMNGSKQRFQSSVNVLVQKFAVSAFIIHASAINRYLQPSILVVGNISSTLTMYFNWQFYFVNYQENLYQSD